MGINDCDCHLTFPVDIYWGSGLPLLAVFITDTPTTLKAKGKMCMFEAIKETVKYFPTLFHSQFIQRSKGIKSVYT